MSEESIAAGKKNLKPFQDRPKGELKLIAAKGGQVSSEAKTQAARWKMFKARMQKRGIDKETQEWLIARIENRDLCAIDILQYAEEIKNDIHPAQRVALANTLIAAGKFAHGEKIRTEALNVNINSSQEEWERRMME